MRRLFIWFGLVVWLTACSNETQEYKTFIKKYGSETRTFCNGIFLMRETFLSPEAKAPVLELLNSNKCKRKNLVWK